MNEDPAVFLGILLTCGGALATLSWLLFAITDPDHIKYHTRTWNVLNGLVIVGGVLMAAGLPGVYLRQAAMAGFSGMGAFAFLFIGIAIPYIAVHSIETATAPGVPRKMSTWVAVGAPSLWIGSVWMGISLIQAGVYPPSAGTGLLIGAGAGVLTLFSGALPAWLWRNLASVPWTLAVTWLGILTMIG